MGKITKIISEIQNFFSKKRLSSVMETFTNLLDGLPVDSRMLGGLKRDNCKLTNLQVFQLLVLLPFFGVPGFSHYAESVLNRMFGGKKDILYCFMSCDDVDWPLGTPNIGSDLIDVMRTIRTSTRAHTRFQI